MIRPLDRHLDSDELDALVASQAPGVPVAERLSEEAVREAQRHVESCRDCDRKVQMHGSAQSAISLRAMSGHTAKGPNCSDETEWVKVAAGMFEEAEAKERMNHAAQCGHCGPLLKAAVKSLSDETTPDEEGVVANLASARRDWQAQMARTLRSASEPRQAKEATRSFWRTLVLWPRLAFAAAAVAILVTAAWVGVGILRPPSAEQLLAQAYTERRTIEVRIPGAKYAPVRVERSAGSSSFDKPQSLLKAEALIGGKLRQNPNDPEWLDAKARAELLDGDYDDAIKTLQRARESQPDSAELLRDLGSAYYLRGQSANRPEDYGSAVEFLGQALQKKPDDLVALFNRGLACEQHQCYRQAAEDWENYLRIDPNGEWSYEARQRLQQVKPKVDGHNESSAIPLLTPADITKESAGDKQTIDKLNERIEDYLSLATNEWLPNAYPTQPAESAESRQTQEALHVLARVLKEKHDDTWLEELLAGSSSQDFTQAVEDLAAAVRADEQGNNVLGLQRSREAQRLFAHGRNYAGHARAHVESVFAAHDAQDATTCMNLANRGRMNPKAQSYRWLTIQFHLEEGTCYRLSGNLGEARQLYEQAASEAQRSKYPVIYLRAQDHLSTLDCDDGDLAKAWARSQRGLRLFWSGPYPAMRGYNFYFNLYELARMRKQPNLQIAVWRDGVALSDTFNDYIIRAMAHSLMGDAAVAAGQTDLAKREFQLSTELFARAPQIKSTRIAHIEAETRLAQVEVGEGQAPSAVARLRQYSQEVEHLSDNILGILFDTSLANAEAAAGNQREGESALYAAVALSELHLRTIHDERSRMEWANRTSSTYRYLVQLELLKGDSQGALELWEWYRGAALRVGVSSNVAAGVNRPELLPQRVAETLPTLTKATYISYALLPRGIAIWVYDNRGVFSQWTQTDPQELFAKADQFRLLCADSRSEISDIQSIAHSLYQTLVAPIEAHLAADRVLVIDADDGISGLPFDALVDSQNRYFGERYTGVSSLGLYYQPDVNRTGPISADSAALAVAVPTSHATDGHAPTLSDAVSEAETTARNFSNSHLLSDSDATADAVLAQLPLVAIFHFAGHTLSFAGRSGLLLSDGLLTAASLQKAHLPHMQLAVLSACETQSGTTGGAESSDSLVRTFLRAGAARVLASRWNVDSVGTREFMDLFYRALLAGNTVAESMHQAQSALRSQPRLSHPYYWAAFTAFGAI